jgi:hypothetical protein
MVDRINYRNNCAEDISRDIKQFELNSLILILITPHFL